MIFFPYTNKMILYCINRRVEIKRNRTFHLSRILVSLYLINLYVLQDLQMYEWGYSHRCGQSISISIKKNRNITTNFAKITNIYCIVGKY